MEGKSQIRGPESGFLPSPLCPSWGLAALSLSPCPGLERSPRRQGKGCALAGSLVPVTVCSVHARVCVCAAGSGGYLREGKFAGSVHSDLVPQLGLSYLQTDDDGDDDDDFTLCDSIHLLKNEDNRGGYSAQPRYVMKTLKFSLIGR